jgi:hypothetical protein
MPLHGGPVNYQAAIPVGEQGARMRHLGAPLRRNPTIGRMQAPQAL